MKQKLPTILAKSIVPALITSLFALIGEDDTEAGAFTAFLATFAGYYPLTMLLGVISEMLPWRLGPRTAALFSLCFAVLTLGTGIELQIFSVEGTGEIAWYYINGLWQLFLYVFSITLLFAPPGFGNGFEISFRRHWAERSWLSWTWRIPAAMMSYILLYFAIGAIAYIFTAPYYSDPAFGLNLTVPPVGLIFRTQIVRSMIYVLALSSLIAGLPGSRTKVALLLGLALFTLGGLTPLISNHEWPAALRFYHTVEIFFQNAFAGIAMVYLLKPAVKHVKYVPA